MQNNSEEKRIKKRKIEEDNLLDKINVDIWSIILSYLDGQNDFLILIQISKSIYETLCCKEIFNQIIWKIFTKSIKSFPISMKTYCTPFEKRYFDILNISFEIKHYYTELLDHLPKNLVSLSFIDYTNIFRESISKYIKSNTSLKDLSIRNNVFRGNGIKYIIESFEENKSLRKIDIYHHEIDSKCAEYLYICY